MNTLKAQVDGDLTSSSLTDLENEPDSYPGGLLLLNPDPRYTIFYVDRCDRAGVKSI